ncbi:hypothetical protein [Micromonospora sp. KC606]|uniref:hypothetical protein n=1 Tax=Micromonospora sp. KC606 TaxID=2530379 RepID=UPI001A9EF1C9|nr:hypothetical protein [Micromonospora sp. KC606]
MSAVEVIMVALAAGAGAGVKDTASAAVRDAYGGLKVLLKRRISDDGAAQALDADETDPGVWQTRLGGLLTEVGADRDEQVLAVARRLLELVDPAGSTAGKYHVDVREAKGVQVGDHNTQRNTFS